MEEKPDHNDGHDTLGAVLGQMGRTQEAAEQFRTAIRIQPNDSEAHCNLGNVLLAQGKFADASNEFQSALRIFPDIATAHFGLGAARLNLGRPMTQSRSLGKRSASIRTWLPRRTD